MTLTNLPLLGDERTSTEQPTHIKSIFSLSTDLNNLLNGRMVEDKFDSFAAQIVQ